MKFLLVFLLMATPPSFASDKGNGGDGVMLDNKVYLFDLYEVGNHLTPSLSLVQATEEDLQLISGHFQVTKRSINDNLKQGFTSYNYDDFTKEVANKITELKKADLLFGYMVQKAVLAHTWNLVPYELNDVKDDDGSDIKLSEELVQVAVRSYRSIKLDNNLVRKMELSNLVATVFHEAIFSLLRPEKQETYYKQHSRRAREIVGYIFSGPLTKANLKNIVSGNIPVGAVFNVLLAAKNLDVVVYNFNIRNDYFNPTEVSSLNKVFSEECNDVSVNSMNAITMINSTILGFQFNSFPGKDNSEKYYFAFTYDKTLPLQVVFNDNASKEKCTSGLIESFYDSTTSLNFEPVK